ncbi:MAG: hypothetical protein ACLT90_13385 [Enterococcus raffinosus]
MLAIRQTAFSKMRNAGDYLHSKEVLLGLFKEKWRSWQDRKIQANYNTFWDERNYLPFIKERDINKCDVSDGP